MSKLESFVALIEHFKVDAKELTLHELMQEIIDETGYIESIQAESEIEAQARIENIDELLNKVVAYEEVCEEHDEPVTLSGFLEEVALVADIDNLDENSDYVVLMTLHSAKGLEFPRVYLAGMEDGLFPSYMTVTADDPDELEEERRLCKYFLKIQNITDICPTEERTRRCGQTMKMVIRLHFVSLILHSMRQNT